MSKDNSDRRPKDIILEVHDLKKHFNVGKDKVAKAINGISFEVYRGETLGIVGESGCGKSTVGKTLIKLYEPTSGKIIFDHKDATRLNNKELLEFSRKMQMIFQDPYASLNPRMVVMDIIAEGIDIHGLYKGKAREERVYDLLERVGLNKGHADRFAHEFSGGQRQRIGIARAMAVEPQFIIADEPISALDVSIQAQVVNLMRQLQKEFGITFLFIAHDLSMVKYISDRVGVMYLGRLVELAVTDDLYDDPLHPYTRALLSAVPIADPEKSRSRERIILQGEVPSPIDPPSGCPFRTRCPHVMDICSEVFPEFKEVKPGHKVACHLY